MLETGMLLASRSTGDLDHNRLALWPRRVFDTLSYTGRRGSAALNVFVVKTRVLSTGMGRSLLVATRSVRRRCNLNLGRGGRRSTIAISVIGSILISSLASTRPSSCTNTVVQA